MVGLVFVLGPIENYERLPLSCRQPIKLDIKAVKPWLRYSFDRLWGTSADGERFAYYVERGEPTVMQFEHLENEFFASSLQKVNVDRTESIVRFCERYGFPVSSGYNGAQRLSLFRSRFKLFNTDFQPLKSEWDILASESASAAGIPLFSSAYSEDDETLLGRRPYYLSEEARRIHLNDRSVVGAISEAEAIQTIRALQVSTALITAVAYGLENTDTWGANEVADYLCDRSHMAQNGISFFLLSNSDALLKNTRLKSYDALILESSEFKSIVQQGENAGFSTRESYTSTLADGLVTASNTAISFLANSLLSYRFDGTGGTPDEAEGDSGGPLAAWSHARKKTHRRPSSTRSYGCLPEAIISQFGLLYDDPAEWRICDNCGRIFKKYREEKPGRVIQKTRFCKRSCANSYSKKKSQGLITEQSV